MATKITLDDLLNAEEQVLNRIADELTDEVRAPSRTHASHTMGHSTTGGHNSISARVETIDDPPIAGGEK